MARSPSHDSLHDTRHRFRSGLVRHWLVKPELMCMQHRAGEHLECHMFLGAMQQGKQLAGFYDKGLFFGPEFLYYRHYQLALFLRGHQSPIWSLQPGSRLGSIPGLSIDREQYPDIKPTIAVRNASLRTLLSRCPDCLSLHKKAKDEGRKINYRIDSRALLQYSRDAFSSGGDKGNT